MRSLRSAAVKTLSLVFTITVLSGLFLAAPKAAVAAKKEKAKAEKPAAAAVDINSADEKTIAAIPGIGKKTARDIVAGRPFRNLDELKRVKGMNEGRLKQIAGKVTFGAASPAAAAKPAPAPVAAPAKAEKPAKAAPAEKIAKDAGKLAPGERVNINTASKEQLDKLPGVGGVKAQAIIDNRPYSKPEDIMKVKGIKEKQYEKLKDYITVR